VRGIGKSIALIAIMELDRVLAKDGWPRNSMTDQRAARHSGLWREEVNKYVSGATFGDGAGLSRAYSSATRERRSGWNPAASERREMFYV
jgi:hypothetical protein